MSSLTKSTGIGDLVAYEEDNNASRRVMTVLSGGNVVLGEVIGKIKTVTPTTGVIAGTGNGTCTAVTGGPETKLGDYVATCVEVIADGGRFAVKDPDGEALPDAVVGTAYANKAINFTLNDGATDFALGDTATITVTAGSNKIAPIDFSGVNGLEDAFGIMAAPCDASSSDKKGLVIWRNAAIDESKLVWPGGATADQKAAALEQLAKMGIVGRETA
jgi:hypothetical protein